MSTFERVRVSPFTPEIFQDIKEVAIDKTNSEIGEYDIQLRNSKGTTVGTIEGDSFDREETKAEFEGSSIKKVTALGATKAKYALFHIKEYPKKISNL